MSCKKCGTFKEVMGPIYKGPGEYMPSGFVVPLQTECLVYRCLECGYSYSTPTEDNKKPSTTEGQDKDGY